MSARNIWQVRLPKSEKSHYLNNPEQLKMSEMLLTHFMNVNGNREVDKEFEQASHEYTFEHLLPALRRAQEPATFPQRVYRKYGISVDLCEDDWTISYPTDEGYRRTTYYSDGSVEEEGRDCDGNHGPYSHTIGELDSWRGRAWEHLKDLIRKQCWYEYPDSRKAE